MTCGGASRAILGANLRTQLQSRTEVHSFSFALIYPQPCATIHPPVATNHFERSVTGGAAHGARAFLLAQNKIWQNHFFKILFSSAEKIEKQAFFWFYGISVDFFVKSCFFLYKQLVISPVAWYIIRTCTMLVRDHMADPLGLSDRRKLIPGVRIERSGI